jgi:hypothetical protein
MYAEKSSIWFHDLNVFLTLSRWLDQYFARTWSYVVHALSLLGSKKVFTTLAGTTGYRILLHF